MSKAKVHLRNPILHMTMCGTPWWELPDVYENSTTTDPSAVTCLRCRKTRAFREAVEKARMGDPNG
jgi:hypothetical protein